MSRSPLSVPERTQLMDVASFNRGPGRGGWKLADRELSSLELAGLEATGATLSNLQMEDVVLGRAQFRDSSFRRVDFGNTGLDEAVFEGVTFAECSFEGTSSEGAVFRNCTFRKCRARDWKLARSVWEDCLWEEMKAEEPDWGGATLARFRLARSELLRPAFHDARIETFSLDQTILVEGNFIGTIASQISVNGGRVEETVFNSGDVTGILCREARVARLGFGAMTARNVEVLDCPEVQGLSFDETRLQGFRLANCPRVADLHFTDGAVSGLELSGSEITSLVFFRSSVGPTSRLTNLRIDACEWRSARVDGLKITDSQFTGPLVFKDAEFQRLSLSEVRYGRDLEIIGTGKFTDGDSFPQK